MLPGEVVAAEGQRRPAGGTPAGATWARGEGATSNGPVGPHEWRLRADRSLEGDDRAELDHRLLAAEPPAGRPGGRRRARPSGSCRMRQLDIDAFPDTTPVQVQINTVAPALGPEEVETADHLPDRAGARRPARAREPAVGVEVRPVAGGRHVRGRHRHLLRPPARQRAARRRASCRPASTRPKMGPVVHRAGRGVPLRRHRHRATTSTELRTDPRLGHQAAAADGPGHGRGQHLGRLREAVPGPHRPGPADQARPDLRPGGRGRREEQPERRRRQHPPERRRCCWSTASAGPPTVEQIRRHRRHGQGRRAGPGPRRGRRARSGTRSAAGR